MAEVIDRVISHPLAIPFRLGPMRALSVIHKPFSEVKKEAMVAEDFIITHWIDLSAPTSTQKGFLASLAMSALPHTHFFAFYSALVDRFVALDCARLTGEYRLERAAAKRTARSKRLAACHELETRIAEYKGVIEKETQFNRQVESNTKIKKLENHLELMITDL